ncbi:MAG: TolC family protein [Nitrospiria bacterium]
MSGKQLVPPFQKNKIPEQILSKFFYNGYFLTMFFFLLGSPFTTHAASPQQISLSLHKAVMIALKNNVDLQIEREQIQLREWGLDEEEAQFNPSLRFDIKADRTIRSSAIRFETGGGGTSRIVQENQRVNAGINQRFRWGGDYALTIGQLRSEASFQAINPTYNGDLTFSVTQPLLRGFGREIIEGPIRIAITNAEISQADLQVKALNLILNVSDAYWNLIFHLENLKVNQQTLQSAKQLLKSIKAKVDLGLLAPIEILVADAEVASREEGVVIAKKEVLDTQDLLRNLLNLPTQSSDSPSAVLPMDRPTETKQNIDEKSLLEWALTHRPELEQNRLLMLNRQQSRQIAENQLSPSLDFVGSVGLNGLGAEFSDDVDQLISGSFHQWAAGLVLSFPIGNHAAQANLQKQKTEIRKTMLDRTRLIQQIILETKKGLRRVETDFQRIKTTQRARFLSEEKLSAGNERFQLGLLSSQDLLEFQDDLSDAKRRELKAVIDYNKSLVNLDKSTGALFGRYEIEMVPPRN